VLRKGADDAKHGFESNGSVGWRVSAKGSSTGIGSRLVSFEVHRSLTTNISVIGWPASRHCTRSIRFECARLLGSSVRARRGDVGEIGNGKSATRVCGGEKYQARLTAYVFLREREPLTGHGSGPGALRHETEIPRGTARNGRRSNWTFDATSAQHALFRWGVLDERQSTFWGKLSMVRQAQHCPGECVSA